MTLRLRVRLLLSALLGALLVVSVGSALQFREIVTLVEDVIEPDTQVLESSAEMQRLLGAPERGPEFEQAFRDQLEIVVESGPTEEAQAVADAFEARIAGGEAAPEAALRESVATLLVVTGEQARVAAETVRGEATTAAIGLGIVGAAVLVIGAWVTGMVRTLLLDRLIAIDSAVQAIRRGESTRRVGVGGDDELARVAAALDLVLDLRDKAESAMHGRNSELRALLVALLQHWPRPAAVTGIDGEIIVSTLSPEQEGALRAVTGQMRKAARTLLSRKFVSAAELATDLRVDETHTFAIRALALGEQRIVGWIAEFGPGRVVVGARAE
jgi:hypothetical protein